MIGIQPTQSSDKESVKLSTEVYKHSPKFTRIDSQTLKFEGPIQSGTYNDYLKNINDATTTLIVDSSGGDSFEAVRMGLDIYKRNLTVIVDGIALSSAANYLFLAGRKKIIRKGCIGFHGNAQAFMKKTTFKDFCEDIQNKLKKQKIVPKDNICYETKKEYEKTITFEKEFYKKTGVSQALFDLTQTDEKGLKTNLGEKFVFLIPSAYTLKKFGVTNVEGESDVHYAELLGLRVIYY